MTQSSSGHHPGLPSIRSYAKRTRACKQRGVCTGTSCDNTCVAGSSFPLVAQRRKAVACFPDISTIKPHCVGFADGHICASSSFALFGWWDVPDAAIILKEHERGWEVRGAAEWGQCSNQATVLDAHRPCLWGTHRSS